MNIHEHQAKEIFKQFGLPVPNGVVIFDANDIKSQTDKFKSSNLVINYFIILYSGGIIHTTKQIHVSIDI